MNIIKKPRLKSSININTIDSERIIVNGSFSGTMLTSKSHTLVMRTIAEQDLSTDELMIKLMGQLMPIQLVQILNDLIREGYITESYPADISSTAGFWESLKVNPHDLAEQLKNQTISIQALNTISPSRFIEACKHTGIKTSESGLLQVVLSPRHDLDELALINEKAIIEKKPWLLIQPLGSQILIGPLFNSKPDSACWECLKHRLDYNQPHTQVIRTLKGNAKINYPQLQHPLATQTAYNLAAIEIAKWFSKPTDSSLHNQLLSFDFESMQSEWHQVIQRPQCSVCSSEEFDSTPQPISLSEPINSLSNTQGGYRTVSATETFENYKKHISEITGIVPYVIPRPTPNNSLIHNYSSGRNIALEGKMFAGSNRHIRSNNGGKGTTEAQAKASALCEAIERYSIIYHGQDYNIWDAYKNLENAIHPNMCMNFSNAQYQSRNIANKSNTKLYQTIPQAFNEEEKMAWTPVYSLTEHKFKYLPSCFCFAQYPIEDNQKIYSYPDSNGCAAGNTLEEAMLQGFLELAERDAVAIWWYNRVKRPQVDLSSIQSIYVEKIVQYFSQLDRSLWVLDITNDLQIPCFVAISHVKSGKREEIMFGFGSHVDATIAIERSITELNQLLGVIGKDGYHTKDPVFVDWLTNATLIEHDYLAPSHDEPINIQNAYNNLCKPTINDALKYCINAAQHQDLETLVLDLTQADIGLPVVRVFVPGLRHFWKRTGAGRLYDVPVKLGWMKNPLDEKELNPLGMFV